MKKLARQIGGGILTFFLATELINGVAIHLVSPAKKYFGLEINKKWQIIVLLGIVLGIVNFFIKPILKLITLPLTILTLGLFSFVLNVLIIWLLDRFFVELSISGLIPLFWTTIMMLFFSFVLN